MTTPFMYKNIPLLPHFQLWHMCGTSVWNTSGAVCAPSSHPLLPPPACCFSNTPTPGAQGFRQDGQGLCLAWDNGNLPGYPEGS